MVVRGIVMSVKTTVSFLTYTLSKVKMFISVRDGLL